MAICFFAKITPLEKTKDGSSNGSYSICFPELSDKIERSTSFEEAIAMAHGMLLKMVQKLIFLNKPVPIPLTKDAFEQAYIKKEGHGYAYAVLLPDYQNTPVKVTLTLPWSIHAQLESRAMATGMSKSHLITSLLQQEFQ